MKKLLSTLTALMLTGIAGNLQAADVEFDVQDVGSTVVVTLDDSHDFVLINTTDDAVQVYGFMFEADEFDEIPNFFQIPESEFIAMASRVVEFKRSLDDVDTVKVNCLGGNDAVLVDANANIKVHANGGTGDDNLLGGAKADVLLGGPGKDTLSGRGGMDYLDGGKDGERDRLNGGDDKDVLIQHYKLKYLPTVITGGTQFWWRNPIPQVRFIISWVREYEEQLVNLEDIDEVKEVRN